MGSQIERVTAELRRRVFAQVLAPGERLVEMQLAAELKVSRTPLRIAFGELEREGLLERLPTRGFRVRQVTLDEVAQAIDVRGVLEGMAVRAVAEAGPSAALLEQLRSCVEEGRAVLASPGPDGSVDLPRWAAMNERFHGALVEAAANPVLASALAHIGRAPLAAPGALGFGGRTGGLEAAFLQRAQFDHEDVLGAIEAREGARAEALMREHARRSRDNKRQLIQVTSMQFGYARSAAVA